MSSPVIDHPAIQALAARLSSADEGIRRIALIDLDDLEEPAGLPWLLAALRNDAAATVRAEAARLLEAWEGGAVVEALCAALADAEGSVRTAAAQSLSELRDPELGRLLLPWTAHADPFVRAAALRGKL